MDPTILEQLYSQGKISQQTYDMAKANTASKTAIGTAPANPKMMLASAPTVTAPAPQLTGEQMTAPAPVSTGELASTSAPLYPTPTGAPIPAPTPQVPAPTAPVVTPVTSSTVKTETGSTSTSTTTGKVKSAAEKQAEKDYGSSIEAQKNANAGGADIAKRKGAEQFEIEQERTRMLQEQQDIYKKTAEEAQKEMDARLAKIDADVETMKNTKYDGFWTKKSTGEKILGAIAVGLGAYGASMGGSKQNYAMDIINKAMDQDFDQYKQGVEQQIKGIEQSRLSLASKDALVKSKLDQLNTYKLGQEAVLKSKIESLGSKFAGEQAQNDLAKLNAALDERSATKRMDIEKDYMQTYTNTITKEFSQMRVDANGNVVSGAVSKAAGEQAGDIDKSNAKLSPIRSEIASALKMLEDPNVSEEDKIRIGQGLVKTLNSTQGADAVGSEEAQRLASELESSLGTIGRYAAGVGGTGAVIGGSIAGPVGAAIGTVVGGVGGAIAGAIDAASKPGGLHLKPDVKGFTERVRGTLDKIDGTMSRNDKVAALVRKGYTVSEANKVIDAEEAAKNPQSTQQSKPQETKSKTPIYDAVKKYNIF